MLLVSIVVVTYNHEPYIREALQSIVDQKVNFSYEVIVANDASSDRTLSIVREFEQNYPGIFVVQDNEQNLGVLQNVVKLISLVNGKYFAILDGDDYWSYEHKLQQQIDFLEAHTEYNGIFHDAKIIAQDETAEKKLFALKKLYSQSYFYKEEIHSADILNRLILPSSSSVFRTDKELLNDLSMLEDDFSVGWKLSCLFIRFSKFYYVNEPWSVYRNHRKGISKSSNGDFHCSHIRFLEKLIKDEYFSNYKHAVYKAISNEYAVLLNSSATKHKKALFRKYLVNELKRIWHYRKEII